MINITETIDCMGEKCPYPDVHSKKRAKKMKPGEVLRVLTDYPLATERIPETMKSLGHEVISLEEIGKSEWQILIKINKKKK